MTKDINTILEKVKNVDLKTFEILSKAEEQDLIVNAPIIYNFIDDYDKDIHFKINFEIIDNKIKYFLVPSSKESKNEEIKQQLLKNYIIKSFDDSKVLLNIKDDVDHNKERNDILLKINDLIKGKDDKGFYLYGPFGTGKTFISITVLNYFASKGMKVAHVVLPELISKMKDSFSAYNDDLAKLLIQIKASDVLLIDDIGGEIVSDWSRDEFLFSLLNSRMENKKLTLLTSNLSPAQLRVNFRIKGRKGDVEAIKADRIVERIKALSTPIFLEEKNRRD